MYLFFKRRREKLDSTILKHYHKQAFWFKIIASLLFMVYYTYMTGGDTRTLYFLEGKNLFHLLLQDGSNWKYIFTAGKNMNEHLLTQTLNIGYLQSEANFMIIRLTAILSFLTFGQYTLIGLFFACFAFSGLWKLFMFFYERKPELHKALAISILFFPSVVFWSSGLMKDSLMIGALGWFTYSLDQFSSGKNLVRNFLILSLAAYMMITVKVYIFLAYAPLLFLFILFEKLKAIKAVLLRVFLVLVVIVVSIFSFLYAYSSFEEELGTYALENVTSSMEKLNTTLASMTAEQGAESNFNLGAQFEGTPQSLIKVAPFAIVASFFRPFIWEASKVSQLLSALESLALMLITLFLFVRLGPFRMVRFYLSDPMIFFCLTFALVFGVFIGATTVNFGTLVRYKIPCLPFYAIALALLYNKYNARQYKGKITL